MKRIEKQPFFLHYFLVGFLVFYLCTKTIYGTGSADMDTGGGSMSTGTSTNRWSIGDDGVRVTVFHTDSLTAVSRSIDLTDTYPASGTYHFGKANKLSYRSSSSLSIQTSSYSCINPTEPLPEIINASGSTNIDAIKSYFTDEQVLRSVAGYVSMDYDELICGDYVLMVEPLAYVTYSGNKIAMTATEAALYDAVTSGDLYYKLRTVTHRNLPLAIFLEEGGLGISPWTGSTSTFASNSNIISYLGVGLVRFDEIPLPPELETTDYVYRTDTEVITAVTITGGQSDPDNPTTVFFNIDGTIYDVGNVYYPDGASQLTWVKWRTPVDETTVNITVTVEGPGGTTEGTIRCLIEDLDKNPPPNPVADDRNDSFSATSAPIKEEMTSTNWTTFTPRWEANWIWNGLAWVDLGEWAFDVNLFTASLSAEMNVIPDLNNPTASSSAIKSGYGFMEEVISVTSTNGESAVSQTPNAVTYFPEFNYETYWRLLDRIRTGLNSQLEFKENSFSTYKNRTHFTPIWYLDGIYTVYTWFIDVWTPTGMLSMNLSDSLTISGNLWEDWHIGPQ